MTDLLYRWPDAATVGRRMPKEKLYEKANVTAAVREKFVSEVQSITWAYKLAEITMNLPGTGSVPEVQVFQIELKSDHLADTVLATIDKAIPLPIIFEISRTGGARAGSQTRMIAAPKQLGGGAPKLGSYIATDWQPTTTERIPLPSATNLTGLYTAILHALTPFPSRPGETVSQVADRLAAVRTLEREIAAFERKLKNEPQLNRKVGLRRTLKTKQAMLANLASPTSGPPPYSTK